MSGGKDQGVMIAARGQRLGRVGVGLLLLLVWLLWPRVVARAHVGAPYPVLLEQPLGPYVVSALADPDVGVGTFIMQVALADGAPAPADTAVKLSVRPEDGHAPESAHQAQRQVTRDGERFIVKVPFDARGMWEIGLAVAGTAGQGEVAFSVEVTPPYPGVVTTLVCLLPFVALGGLWAAGALRSRRSSDAAPQDAEPID
jgi:hypothetical protein